MSRVMLPWLSQVSSARMSMCVCFFFIVSVREFWSVFLEHKFYHKMALNYASKTLSIKNYQLFLSSELFFGVSRGREKNPAIKF